MKNKYYPAVLSKPLFPVAIAPFGFDRRKDEPGCVPELVKEVGNLLMERGVQRQLTEERLKELLGESLSSIQSILNTLESGCNNDIGDGILFRDNMEEV